MHDEMQGGAGGVPLDDGSADSRRRRPTAPDDTRRRRGQQPGRDAGTGGEAGDALTPNVEAQEESADKHGKRGGTR